MIFHELDIPGAFLLEPEGLEDRRGFFARTYCRHELERRGLDPTLVRCEISVNRFRGAVCGLRYQGTPYEEARLVRCTAGAIFEVIVDLRRDSSAFKRHVGIEISAESRRSLYVPEGVGHGFQTLEDDTEVFVQTSEFDYPEYACGVRWNDPSLQIAWPRKITSIADEDLDFPDLEG